MQSNWLITTLENQVSRFWESEEIPKRVHLFEEEQAREQIYIKTTKRYNEGRYIVELPFKNKQPSLADRTIWR